MGVIPDDADFGWTGDKRFDQAGWKGHVRLLDLEHRALRAAGLELPAGLRPETPPGSGHPRQALALGIDAHDVYHARPIQLLERLRALPSR